MNDKFQILRDFAKSNDKPNKDIYQFVKEILDMNSAYAKENKQLKIQISAREEVCNRLESNWNKLKKYMIDTEQIYKKSDDKYIKDMHEIGIRHAYQTILYKMYVLEQGSDSNE